MKKINLVFTLNLPSAIRDFSFFDLGGNALYFDTALESLLFEKIKKYLEEEVFSLLNGLRKNQISYSIALGGEFLDQLQKYAPTTFIDLCNLIKSQNIELLGCPYYKSLSSWFSDSEFKIQVQKQKQLMKDLFDVETKMFCNTALIGHNKIFNVLKEEAFEGTIIEGLSWYDTLDGKQFSSIGDGFFSLCMRDSMLSNLVEYDIFQRKNKFYRSTVANVVTVFEQESQKSRVLVIDLIKISTFVNQEKNLSFLNDLFRELKSRGFQFNDFSTVTNEKSNPISVPFPTSSSRLGQDLFAWCGNSMQKESLKKLYELEENVLGTELEITWRKIQSIEYFEAMSTVDNKEKNSYSKQFQTPYDAYINVMNIISDMQIKLGLA